jgi:hypothetical protein
LRIERERAIVEDSGFELQDVGDSRSTMKDTGAQDRGFRIRDSGDGSSDSGYGSSDSG